MPSYFCGRAMIALMLTLGWLPAVAQPAPPQRGIMPRQQNAMPGPLMDDAPGAGLPFADPLQLLVNSFQVQQDLGLTPHQVENLKLASRNFMTQMQELMAPKPGVTPEQARAAIAEQMAKTRPMINRELTPEQIARLQQIMLQIEGPCQAIVDPRLSGQLGLSSNQQTQGAAACHERGQQMRAAFRPPAPGEDPCHAAAENRDRIERIRAQTDARVVAMFSPAQQATFASMQARHLDLEPPMPPGCQPPGHAG